MGCLNIIHVNPYFKDAMDDLLTQNTHNMTDEALEDFFFALRNMKM